MDEKKLKELALEACDDAKRAGVGIAETYVEDSRSVSVEIEKNSVRTGDVEYDAGYCTRAFHEGGAGFSRGSGLSPENIKQSGSDAFALAKESEADTDFKDLPATAEYASVDSLYSDEVADFKAADAIQWCMNCIDIARELEPEVIVKGGFSAGSSVSALANTNGVATTSKGSFISFYVFSMVKRGDKVGSYYEYSQARRMEDLKSAEEVSRIATEKAVSFLGSTKINSGKYPVVFGPLATRGFVGSIIDAASAEEIQRGRSYLHDRLGKQIAPDLLSVIEDPLIPAGLSSSSSDGEGVPRIKRALIDSGTLTTFLHNSYTANKAGEKSTGHAARGSYSSSVGIGLSNMSITPGDTPEKDIISNIKDGLYIYMGSISPNPVTGQISGTVDFGFHIVNGELAHPVENVMIGGDVFSFLDSIETLSSDYREEAGNISPSMLLGGISVASA